MLLPLVAASARAQDYVITWANDTVACVFPEKPGKKGLRPASKYENGHLRTAAFFPNDSMRVLEAGAVKAYYCQVHGRDLLCNGYFEAKKVTGAAKRALYHSRGNPDNSWYFMNRVVAGKYASLYVVYIRFNKLPVPVYFVSKHNDPDPLEPTLLGERKKLEELFSDDDIKEAMRPLLLRKARKRYPGIVREYNRLKGAASKLE